MNASCPTCGQPFPDDLWRFDIDNACLIVGEHRIDLSPHEGVFLGLLLKHRGRPVHRDSLIIGIWDQDEPGDAHNNIDVLAHRIRTKLKGTILSMVTHHGFGYSIAINKG